MAKPATKSAAQQEAIRREAALRLSLAASRELFRQLLAAIKS
jgi:hypothetical protein